jgi:hypothetical protein
MAGVRRDTVITIGETEAMSSASGAQSSTQKRGARQITSSENKNGLMEQPTAEHFHTVARLRELAAEATTPSVKQYLCSLIHERERMAGEHNETGFRRG